MVVVKIARKYKFLPKPEAAGSTKQAKPLIKRHISRLNMGAVRKWEQPLKTPWPRPARAYQSLPYHWARPKEITASTQRKQWVLSLE